MCISLQPYVCLMKTTYMTYKLASEATSMLAGAKNLWWIASKASPRAELVASQEECMLSPLML